jgi:hypothetical protein
MSRRQAELLLVAALLTGAWLALGPPLRQTPLSAAPRGGRTALRDVPVDGGFAQRAAALRARGMATPPRGAARRNPFAFLHRDVQPAAPAGRDAVGKAPVAPRPEIALSGIAEDAAGGRIVRTAVLSAGGSVVLAKEGDRVLGRFVVSKIAPDAVQLQDTERGDAFTIVLR